jgi:uncharacterized protein (DUF58 family)
VLSVTNVAAKGNALREFDWSTIASLRLRAESIAEGLYWGIHRSTRRGAGVEFSGHRTYVPGDDLRWLDRHAWMRHGRLLVREFETETDRALRLVVDASASMGYRSAEAPASKLEFATLLAAVMARLALAAGDPVALDWLGGADCRWLPPISGRQGFERVVGVLESARADGDVYADMQAIDRALLPVAKYARRGTSIVVLTDLAEMPTEIVTRVRSLCSRGRRVILARILDPAESDYPFRGPVRLRALEGKVSVTTDGTESRDQYLRSLSAESELLASMLTERGGRFLTLRTDDSPSQAIRKLTLAISGAAR